MNSHKLSKKQVKLPAKKPGSKLLATLESCTGPGSVMLTLDTDLGNEMPREGAAVLAVDGLTIPPSASSAPRGRKGFVGTTATGTANELGREGCCCCCT